MKILYFDCYSGISGDMTIGALIDIGVDEAELMQELNKLGIEGYKLHIKKGIKSGITGTHFIVELEDHHDYDHDSHNHHNSFKEIIELILNSDISENAKEMSVAIFEKLAKAEGKVHDVDYEDVHFHEVGAIDSIIDIVGTAICIDILKPDMMISSPVNVGSGLVKCQHGVFPVPAPATLELLKGIPIYSKGVGELTTPTGAAILSTLCNEFGTMPQMVIDKIGYGLGTNDYEIANCLRVCTGKLKKK